MIVTCHNCSARLQLDDAKLPSRPFSVRCPKCQQIINAQPQSSQGSGGAVEAVKDLPVSTRTQHEMSAVPAPVLKSEAAAGEGREEKPAHGGEGDLLRLLAELLQRGAAPGERGGAAGASPRRRRALTCLGTVHRDAVKRALTDGGYEVITADVTKQAVEVLREGSVDVVVLDGEFDMMEQGAAFITRELNYMRPAERRRVLFVQLSATARTGDAHEAFLNNSNLLVNVADVAGLSQALDKTFRDVNEMYRDFNRALGVSEL